MEYVTPILVCALFADSLLTRQKLKDLTKRIDDLEKATSNE